MSHYTTPEDVILSLPTVSENQPKKVGYPFVIHIPEQTWRGLAPRFSHLTQSERVKVTKGAPLFCKTDVPMLRITMEYGDASTAVKMWDVLTSKHKVLAFKNWL